MKPRRIYPLIVGWQKPRDEHPSLRPGMVALVIRPSIPGALVMPTEQAVDPAHPDEQVTFQVMPLTTGRLPDAHLDVLQKDRRVQKLPLPMKAVGSGLTRFLLLLTILVPALLLFVKYNPLEGSHRTKPGYLVERWLRENLPEFNHITDSIAEALGTAYGTLHDLSKGGELPVAFSAFVVLLALTCIAWLLRGSRRDTVVGEPLLVSRPNAEAAS
jgi:hypothetical protein